MDDEKKFKFELQMRGRFLGAMPVMKFLDKYLSPEGGMVDIPSHLQNLIGSVPETSDENSMYDSFVKAIADFIPGFKAENTSNKPACSEFADLQLNPDVCLFDTHFDFKDFTDKSYFSVMEMWIEFKHSEAPFADPPAGNETDQTTHTFEVDSESAQSARGQLAAYALAQHTQQSRHFSYSISIVKSHARFLRWNSAGVVVTEEFDYVEKPELMAKCFWNFSHLTDEQRGHDLSVRPTEKSEVRVNFGLEAGKPLFEYGVPDLRGRCYGLAPSYPSYSIVDRPTRSLPVFYKPNTQDVQRADESCMSAKGQVGYLKDAWQDRYGDDKKIDSECEIYRALNATSIPHVPKLEGRYGSTTETHKLVNEPGSKLCSKPETTSVTHCRLILEVAGRALPMFKSTRELVNGVLCAMVAHEKAFELVKLLHRDVSFGNIILTDDGNGRLIDWDFTTHMDEIGNSRPERTGTWQFMSVKLLPNIKERHTVTDDLESFLHVLAWTTVRYVPSTEEFSSCARKKYLNRYFDDSRVIGVVKGLSGGAYHPLRHGFELKDPSPLPTLLKRLCGPFQSRYADPPHKKRQTRRDVETLKSHTYFINTIEDVLGGAWPSNDKADLSLVNDLSNRMTIQAQQMRKSRMDMDQKQWENLNPEGTAESGSLKRQPASLAPVPSKRCRIAPLGSDTDA